jgi:predicted RNA-binding protein YlxR (DUF448 family)
MYLAKKTMEVELKIDENVVPVTYTGDIISFDKRFKMDAMYPDEKSALSSLLLKNVDISETELLPKGIPEILECLAGYYYILPVHGWINKHGKLSITTYVSRWLTGWLTDEATRVGYAYIPKNENDSLEDSARIVRQLSKVVEVINDNMQGRSYYISLTCKDTDENKEEYLVYEKEEIGHIETLKSKLKRELPSEYASLVDALELRKSPNINILTPEYYYLVYSSQENMCDLIGGSRYPNSKAKKIVWLYTSKSAMEDDIVNNTMPEMLQGVSLDEIAREWDADTVGKVLSTLNYTPVIATPFNIHLREKMWLYEEYNSTTKGL